MSRKQAYQDMVLLREYYRDRPIAFIKDILGVDLYDKQKEIVRKLLKHRKLVVSASRQVGKSLLASCIVYWYLTCIDGAKVVCTAGTYSQLSNILWATLSKVYLQSKLKDLDYFVINNDYIRPNHKDLGKVNFCAAVSPANPDALMGFDGRVLYIVDEASQAEQPFIDAMKGSMIHKDCMLLMIGNPTNSGGYMAQVFNGDTEQTGFGKVHISQFDAPRWLLPMDVIEKNIKEFGGDHTIMSQVFVYGNFCENSDDYLFTRGILKDVLIPPHPFVTDQEKATLLNFINEEASYRRKLKIGIDVARYGNDSTAIAVGTDVTLFKVFRYTKLDSNQVFESFYDDVLRHLDIFFDPNISVEFCIDTNGLGASMEDTLNYRLTNEFGLSNFSIMSFVGHRKSPEPKKTYRLQDYAWYLLSERVKRRDVILALDEQAIHELVSRKYKISTQETITLVSKTEHKKALNGLSPDLADSVVLWSMDSTKFNTKIERW